VATRAQGHEIPTAEIRLTPNDDELRLTPKRDPWCPFPGVSQETTPSPFGVNRRPRAIAAAMKVSRQVEMATHIKSPARTKKTQLATPAKSRRNR
jgi:hypothetical protein